MDLGEAPFSKIFLGSLALSSALVGLDSKPKIAGSFVGLSFSGVCAWLVWKILLYPHFFSPFRDVPTPPGASNWNGHTDVLNGKKYYIRIFRDWLNTIPNDGLIRFMNPLNQERLLLTSPEALHEMQVTRSYDFEKPEIIRYSLGRILGDGLLVAEGQSHKFQRRALAPGFTTKQIRRLYPKFWKKGLECANAMAAEANEPVDIGDWTSRITLDIVGTASLGRDFQSIQNPDNTLTTAYKRIFAPDENRHWLNLATILLPRWTIPYLPLSSNRILTQNTADIRESSRDLIRSKREALEQGKTPETDVLEVLLNSALSEEQLIDQVMTFLAAGHETTAATLTWTVYVLAKHQDIQAKLREEIRSAIPSSETAQELTSEVFEGMPYLQAFISELLRYYPAVPHLVREAVVDTTLVGRHIPKGTRFIVSPGAICYSTEIWGPDAAEFKPERWMKDSALGTAANGGASSKYGFITFLHGHRGCIGQGFTRGEMACILAAWVGKLQFTLHDMADEDEWSLKLKKGGITYHPASGPMIDVKVLDGW